MNLRKAVSLLMRHQTYFHPLGATNYEILNVFLRLNRVEYHGISMHGICVSYSNVSCLSPVTFDKLPTMHLQAEIAKRLIGPV